jgi:hypothetical protein
MINLAQLEDMPDGLPGSACHRDDDEIDLLQSRQHGKVIYPPKDRHSAYNCSNFCPIVIDEATNLYSRVLCSEDLSRRHDAGFAGAHKQDTFVVSI